MFRKKEVTLPPRYRVRDRALTLPLPEPSQTLIAKIQSLQIRGNRSQQPAPQKPCDQRQSILYTLPFEIRQMIWKEVLGDDVVHIMPLKDGIGHVRCINRSGEECDFSGHRCWVQHYIRLGLTIPPLNYPGPEDLSATYPSLLVVLKTCRQIYSESIEYLYKENTFNFRNLETFAKFTTSVLTCRLELLKSVQFSYSSRDLYSLPPNHGVAWKRIVEAISRMKKLRTLRVWLYHECFPRDPADQIKLLQPLVCIKSLPIFEVRVDWDIKGRPVNGILINGMDTFITERPFDLVGSDGTIERSQKLVT